MARTLLTHGFLAAALLSGCAAPSYINIPPLPGDAALHSPNDWVVVDVETVALRHVLERFPPRGPYAIALPEGTSSARYERVRQRLPAAEAERGGGEARVYTVAQVQVRGFNAQVGVVRPTDQGGRQLVSVFLGTDIQGWYVLRSRPWNISVDEALQQIRARPLEETPSEPAPPPQDQAVADQAAEEQAAQEGEAAPP